MSTLYIIRGDTKFINFVLSHAEGPCKHAESTLNRKPNRNVCASLVLGDVSQSTYYVSSGPVCNGRQSAIMTNVSYNNIRYILTKYILYVM